MAATPERKLGALLSVVLLVATLAALSLTFVGTNATREALSSGSQSYRVSSQKPVRLPQASFMGLMSRLMYGEAQGRESSSDPQSGGVTAIATASRKLMTLPAHSTAGVSSRRHHSVRSNPSASKFQQYFLARALIEESAQLNSAAQERQTQYLRINFHDVS